MRSKPFASCPKFSSCVAARNNNYSLPLERSSCRSVGRSTESIPTTTRLHTCALTSPTFKFYNLCSQHLQRGSHFPSAKPHSRISTSHTTSLHTQDVHKHLNQRQMWQVTDSKANEDVSMWALKMSQWRHEKGRFGSRQVLLHTITPAFAWRDWGKLR
jgi:hypothetical protein